MRKRMTPGRLVLVAALLGLATPLVTPASPALAAGLGGYTALAESGAVRVAIFEPAVPIPAEPQVDAVIGFARASTTTGPSSRGLASYLWPGDAVGDGLGTLAGNEAFDYPVKVSSKYPASDTAPATNAIQLTDGNGMATSANETKTSATVTGAGVGSNLASGLGAGLCTLIKQQCPSADYGIEIPAPLATAASLENVKSQSTVTLTEGTITATARSVVSGLSVLAGLITIDGVEMVSTSTSDSAKATSTGTAKVTGLKVAGQAIDLASSSGKNAAVDLAAIGIKLEYLDTTRTVEGATGATTSKGLVITVDVGVLGKILDGESLSSMLEPVLGQIPNAGPLLVGLLKLGTKLVVTVGDVRTSATATPAYVFEETPTGPLDDGGTVPEFSGGVAPPLPTGTIPLPGEVQGIPPVATDVPTGIAPATFQFPGLSQTPSLLILAGLALIGLTGWLFRAFGAFVLGGEDCLLGLSVGVPNLREG